MALKSAIFKVELQLADLDRNHYQTYPLTLARHPSETDERMMVRVIAFALHADPAHRSRPSTAPGHPPRIVGINMAGAAEMALTVVARKSGLHGMGLFAARDLAAGEKLIEYKGKRYGKDEHPELKDDNVTKFLGLSDGTGIDGTGWASLANHGCNPNCELQEEAGRGGRLRAWLHALRDIRQGEELVWDYRLDIKSKKLAYADWACACGAEECRGTMADPDKIKGAADNKASPRKNNQAHSPRTIDVVPADRLGRRPKSKP